MELDEMAALHSLGNQKRRREMFEKQLQMLLNDTHLYKDFKDRFCKTFSPYLAFSRGTQTET